MSLFSRLANSLTTATTVCLWDGHSLTLRKGRLPSPVTSALQETLRNAQNPAGKISLRKNGRIEFSPSIDPSLHQRLRNLLLQV